MTVYIVGTFFENLCLAVSGIMTIIFANKIPA